MAIQGAQLRDRVPLLGIDHGRVAPGAQHLSRGTQEAPEAQPIEALQRLKLILPGTIGDKQFRGRGEKLFGALI
jgi:hypothetical protein